MFLLNFVHVTRLFVHILNIFTIHLLFRTARNLSRFIKKVRVMEKCSDCYIFVSLLLILNYVTKWFECLRFVWFEFVHDINVEVLHIVFLGTLTILELNIYICTHRTFTISRVDCSFYGRKVFALENAEFPERFCSVASITSEIRSTME